MGFAQIILFLNFVISSFAGRKAGRNPWNANGLEWIAPSPPPHGNFDVTPVVYRGPYEYSAPDAPDGQDYWLQSDERGGQMAERH
jgi:cytochrome c oxidase subunit 1